jgi:hypothetical protein
VDWNFPSFFICWIILNCSIVRFEYFAFQLDAGSCLKFVEQVGIFFLAGCSLGCFIYKFQPPVCDCCPVSVLFSSPLQGYLGLACISASRWSLWDLGGGLSICSVLIFFSTLFSSRSTHRQGWGKEFRKDIWGCLPNFSLCWGRSPTSLVLLRSPTSLGLLFWGPWAESFCFGYPALPCILHQCPHAGAGMGEPRERNTMGLASPFLEA